MLEQTFTLKMFYGDMGSYTTNCKGSNMETVKENALWSINSARAHDGLPKMTLDTLNKLIKTGDAKLTAN